VVGPHRQKKRLWGLTAILIDGSADWLRMGGHTLNVLRAALCCPRCGEPAEVDIEVRLGATSKRTVFSLGAPCPWPPEARPGDGFAIEAGYAVCPSCGKGFFVTVLVREGCFAELRTSEFLQRKVTVEELEAEQVYQGVPFGFINEHWRAFIGQMRPGDELWHFRSPPERWAELMGTEGVYLMRDGREIDQFLWHYN